MFVRPAEGTDVPGLILQNVAQGVDAVDAHIGNGAASGDRPVVEPRAGMADSGIGELSPREDRVADVARGDALAKDSRTVGKAKYLGDTQKNAGISSCFH